MQPAIDRREAETSRCAVHREAYLCIMKQQTSGGLERAEGRSSRRGRVRNGGKRLVTAAACGRCRSGVVRFLAAGIGVEDRILVDLGLIKRFQFGNLLLRRFFGRFFVHRILLCSIGTPGRPQREPVAGLARDRAARIAPCQCMSARRRMCLARANCPDVRPRPLWGLCVLLHQWEWSMG